MTEQTTQNEKENPKNPDPQAQTDPPSQAAAEQPTPTEIPPASRPYSPPSPLSPSEERTWAMVSHLSILVNLVTGFLGPAIPLVIYLAFKDRSRYVAFQSMQAFIFQLIAWVGAGIIAIIAWSISGVLAVILIGCLIMPLALLITLIPLAALVYGVIGAVQTNQGQNFKYWLIGDWTLNLLKMNPA
jgi:uncharacterized Tic20 family protein